MQMRKHFDWLIPRQTGDFMSHGCCGMGQAHKPSGLHCRGVNSICGRQAKYTQKPNAEQIYLLCRGVNRICGHLWPNIANKWGQNKVYFGFAEREL